MREREQLQELQRRHAIVSMLFFPFFFSKKERGGVAEVRRSLLFFFEAEGVGGEC